MSERVGLTGDISCASIERMSDDTSRPTDPGEQDELQVPGRVMGVLDNGTLRGVGGKFLPGSKPSTAITSSERALELVAAKQAKLARQRAAEELQRAMGARRARELISEYVQEDTNGRLTTPADAVGYAAKTLYEAGVNSAPDKPRDARDALVASLRMAKLVDEPRSAASVGGNTYVLNLSAGAEAELRARGLLLAGSVDAVAVDVVAPDLGGSGMGAAEDGDD